jgi:AMMECR1 domain-containing protein
VAREQGWSKEEAVVSLMRKAGWGGKKADWKKVDLRVVRYQGRKVSLGYAEWRAWREWVGEEMDDR